MAPDRARPLFTASRAAVGINPALSRPRRQSIGSIAGNSVTAPGSRLVRRSFGREAESLTAGVYLVRLLHLLPVDDLSNGRLPVLTGAQPGRLTWAMTGRSTSRTANAMDECVGRRGS